MKRLALASAVILLAGCQHLSYQPPTGDDTATVTFTSNDVSAQPVICVPGKGFESTEYALASSSNPAALNDLLTTMKKSPTVTTTVAANPGTRIGVIYNQGSAANRDRCRIALQFEPQAGGQYQAHFVYDKDQCGLSLSEEAGNRTDAVLTDWKCP